jgi:ATP sulfurylase
VKRLPSPNKYYELTPSQVRLIFKNKGWSRVIGFHTRNVIHNAHEYIQLEACKRAHCDGIFVHPVIGFKKKGDFSANVIVKCYQKMIEEFYPKEKVLFATFQNYSRYCGPREAVFTALCRKNFGCSHFIVGRDHTGVGSFYEPDSVHNLFDKLGDIGITPVYFNKVYYCQKCENYVESCNHSYSAKNHISGTQVRKILKDGKLPPKWFIRKEIAQTVLNELKQNNNVFEK